MATPGEIQLPVDGPGKQVDTNTLTSTMTGTPTVYRQVVNVGDPTTFGNYAEVTAAGNLQVAVNAALPAGANKIGTVDIATAAAVAKGTQGSNALPTQDLLDSGRTRVNFQAIDITPAGAATETLFSLVAVRNGVAAAGATTQAVTSGKRLRLQSLSFYIRSGAATQTWLKVSLRCNPNGAAIVTSPVEFVAEVSPPAALSGSVGTETIPLPDGMELSGTEQISVTYNALLTTSIIGVVVNGFEY